MIKLKKNIVIKVICVILLIIILGAFIIFRINSKPEDLTVKMYKDICEEQSYTFSMIEKNLDIDYSLTISRDNENMSIETLSDNDHTTILIKDGVAYYVMHLEKEYYLYDSSLIDADIIRSGLSGIENKTYTSGYEEIEGTKYYYEEYEEIPTFLIWASDNDNSESIKTRFYFNKNHIEYIKTIINDTEEELLKIDFKYSVDDSKFEIPEDYVEAQ